MTTFALLAVLGASPAAARPVVVLDPGHGGTNRGARGLRAGLWEKQLTLRVARSVRRYIQHLDPRVEVMLTRERDRYVTLAQRVRKANSRRADLLVSIHLNASPSHSQRGFETFILSRDASAREVPGVAARAPTAASGDEHNGAVGTILSELRLSAAHGEAAGLARTIQRTLARVRGPNRDRGVRQAPFDVLLGLQMPGVLVELGFLDHPLEGQEMVRPALLEALSLALAVAIVEHLDATARAKGRAAVR